MSIVEKIKELEKQKEGEREIWVSDPRATIKVLNQRITQINNKIKLLKNKGGKK